MEPLGVIGIEQKSSSRVIILPYGSHKGNKKNGQSQERQKRNKTQNQV